MQCPSCGAEGTGKFCANCGAKMETSSQYCTECGSKLEPGAKFCPDCGAQQSTSPQAVHPTHSPAQPTLPKQQPPSSGGPFGGSDPFGGGSTLTYLAPGTMLGGFEVVRIIGRGGMGVVYEALYHSLDKPVKRAIKTIPQMLATNQRALHDLKREVRIAQELGHPNIVKTYDLHEEMGVAFISMEFVDGPDFSSFLEEQVGKKVTIDKVVELMEGVADALDYAHSLKPPVIHRDLKPENLLLDTTTGRLKITDFGLAREVSDRMSMMSTLHASSGTPTYMPYEQFMGDKPSAAMDIYSFGIIIYQALAGEVPFARGDIVMQHKEKAPSAIDGLPDSAMTCLQKALAKLPGERFTSAKTFVIELKAPPLPTCPVCGKAEDVERFTCPDCGAEEVCVTHKSKAGLCPECEKERLAEEEKQRKAEEERQRRIAEEQRKKEEEERQRKEEEWQKQEAEQKRLAEEKRKEEERKEEEAARIAAEKKGKEEEERKRRTTPGNLTDGPLPGMKFAYIPAGSFMMGAYDQDSEADTDEKPLHSVSLDNFEIMSTQVTQAMWYQLMQNNPSNFNYEELHPIENISWGDTKDFIEKLNSIDQKYEYRLPTEAEWEYACRAGCKEPFANTSEELDSTETVWYYGNSCGTTHPVAKLLPNSWGIYDMHGNVWEWCTDWYDKDYYEKSPEINPQGPDSGHYKVLRGGSWNNSINSCRSSVRFWCNPKSKLSYNGFRIVRTTHSY